MSSIIRNWTLALAALAAAAAIASVAMAPAQASGLTTERGPVSKAPSCTVKTPMGPKQGCPAGEVCDRGNCVPKKGQGESGTPPVPRRL